MATQSSPKEQAVKTLEELGLTGTEAEVYFAALTRYDDKPISSYRLAQEMDRDAANVGKVLGHLVQAGAMLLVQEKPRLFVPVDAATFTSQMVSRVERHGQAALALLQHCQNPLPDGLTLALPDRTQLLDKARELLAGCQQQAFVFGSRESLREIGAELEEVGERISGDVKILSPTAMVAEHVAIVPFTASPDLDNLLSHQFLHLVVDERAWLSGLLNDDDTNTPAGWWGNHSAIASILSGALALAWQAQPEPEPTLPAPPAPREAEAAAACTDDFTFLIRHADPATKKGEQ